MAPSRCSIDKCSQTIKVEVAPLFFNKEEVYGFRKKLGGGLAALHFLGELGIHRFYVGKIGPLCQRIQKCFI